MNCVFEKGAKCIALTNKDCAGCAFRKTPEELEAGRKAAVKGLCELPRERFVYLRDKYGDGGAR